MADDEFSAPEGSTRGPHYDADACFRNIFPRLTRLEESQRESDGKMRQVLANQDEAKNERATVLAILAGGPKMDGGLRADVVEIKGFMRGRRTAERWLAGVFAIVTAALLLKVVLVLIRIGAF